MTRPVTRKVIINFFKSAASKFCSVIGDAAIQGCKEQVAIELGETGKSSTVEHTALTRSRLFTTSIQLA